MKLILFFLLILLSTAAFSNNSLCLKDIPIVYNLDSLENEVALSKKNNEQNYLNLLFSLEYSRYFFSSNKYATNLNDIKQLVSSDKNVHLAPYYHLFLAINNFRKRNNLDSTLTMLYSGIPFFEKTKDTIALILTYSRLIDIQLIYRDKEFNKRSLIDVYYKKCSLLATNTSNHYTLLNYYFISLRYYYSWANDNIQLLNFSNKGVQLIKETKDRNFIAVLSYFYYYKGIAFMQINQTDSAIYNFKKSIYIYQHPQSGSSLSNYFFLIRLFKLQNKVDSATTYLKITEKKMSPIKSSLYDWNFFYDAKMSLAWLQKQYDTAWLYRNKLDSVNNRLQNELYKIPMRKLNEEYDVENLKLKNIAIEKENLTNKVILFFSITLLVIVFIFTMLTKRKNAKLIKLMAFKTQMQSILSHDLRSPLTGLTQLYEQYNFWIKKNEPQQIQILSDKIDEAAAEMTVLLNNILLWSSTENKAKLNETLNLYSVVNNALLLYKNIISTQNITVQNAVQSELTLFANQNIIELVIRNWLDNTIKYAQPNHIVFYTEKMSNNNIKLCIKDNGTICKEDLHKIQALINTNPNSNIANSLGLGLSLIYEFATKEKWEIQLVQYDDANVFSIAFGSDN